MERVGWSELLDCESVEALLAAGDFDRPTLAQWVSERLTDLGESKAAVIRRSGLVPAHAYQIMQGRRAGSRDKLLRLAFGLRLDPDDASRLLELGGANALDPGSRRDAVLAWCLSRGVMVWDADDLLWSIGEPPLV